MNLTHTSLGCGKKSEYLEKTYADVAEHANSTQTVALVGIKFFFSNQYYNEMVLNATVLFGDLLYLESLSWLPDFR